MALRECKSETAPWVNAPGQYEEGALRWNFYDLNMMGDVAVSPWHDEPFTPVVAYPTEVFEGMTEMEVRVTDADGMGLKNFRCALFHFDEMIGLGYTDETGLAIVEIQDPMDYVADLSLIVTGCDAWPQTITLQLEDTPEHLLSSVAVYPNPNNGQFTLTLPEEACDITIVNALGQMVYAQSGAKGLTRLNLESLSEGMYFVTVKSEKAASTLKLMKE